MRTFFWLLCGAFLAFGPIGQADAATITFTDRVPFQVAAGPTIFENLEDDPFATPLATPHTLLGSGLTVDVLGGVGTAANIDGHSFTPPTDGDKSLAFRGGSANYVAQFESPGLMTAFGFDIAGFQPETFGVPGFAVDMFNGGMLVDAFFHVDNTTMFEGEFKGFVSTVPFDRIWITLSTTFDVADFVGFDQIEFALVPEPSLAALLALAAVGVLCVRRRKT